MALSSFTTRHVRDMSVEYDCCSLPPTIDLLIPPACLNKHMIHHHPACQKLESPFDYFQLISKKQGCIPFRPAPRNVEKKGHFTSLGRLPGEIPTLKPSHSKSEVMEINAPDTTRLNSNVKKRIERAQRERHFQVDACRCFNSIYFATWVDFRSQTTSRTKEIWTLGRYSKFEVTIHIMYVYKK